jgi:hypothetical protein
MKNKVGKILFLLLLICSSCSSIYRFSVDLQEPAAVTLPVSAQKVLILNNTVTQPGEYGIERILDGKPIHTNYPLSLDSMVWSAIDEIADVLDESKFFNTVAIYRQPLRSDSDWLSNTVLAPEIQSDFYNTEDYDALLVINRLLFSVKEDVKKIQQNVSFFEPPALVDLRADGILSCSIYCFGREKPLTAFALSDSLIARSLDTNDSVAIFKAIPEYVLHELSRMLGNQAARRFVPTWKTEDRTLFLSYNARMQEATGYATSRKWVNADSLWTTELGKKTKPADKAKIAFNLAVANEMQDKFELALEWAEKAKEYLKSANLNSNSKEVALTDKYISALEQRIQNNRLLDLQWGKE